MELKPLPPRSTIGILGGGQLGRLLAIAAAKLGFKTFIYAPDEDSPAFDVAHNSIKARYDDRRALEAFAQKCDVVTFEFENVPAETLGIVSRARAVFPSAKAAAVAQDRIAERRFLTGAGLPVAPHVFVENNSAIAMAAGILEAAGAGLLKRARNGYDGKGQKLVSTRTELEAAFATFGAPCVLEAIVPFEREISAIAVRGADGSSRCYDITENHHRDGILRMSQVPAACPAEIQQAARDIALTIANELDYVGVLGVELFVMPEGNSPRLIVNEIAPRVHNTGHWTLDACVISQFENHIRAIAKWPLGSTQRHSDAIMTNLLGAEVLEWKAIAAKEPAVSLYLYGKPEVREGRKLGHTTVISPRHDR